MGGKKRGSDLPRSSTSRSSLLTAPTQGDERRGSWGYIELFRKSGESLAPHLGGRRGGAVRRSELWRRINRVSPLLLPRESILMDLHFLMMILCVFSSFNGDVCDLCLKTGFVYVKTIIFRTPFIMFKMEKWPFKWYPELRGLLVCLLARLKSPRVPSHGFCVVKMVSFLKVSFFRLSWSLSITLAMNVSGFMLTWILCFMTLKHCS